MLQVFFLIYVIHNFHAKIKQMEEKINERKDVFVNSGRIWFLKKKLERQKVVLG